MRGLGGGLSYCFAKTLYQSGKTVGKGLMKRGRGVGKTEQGFRGLWGYEGSEFGMRQQRVVGVR